MWLLFKRLESPDTARCFNSTTVCYRAAWEDLPTIKAGLPPKHGPSTFLYIGKQYSAKGAKIYTLHIHHHNTRLTSGGDQCRLSITYNVLKGQILYFQTNIGLGWKGHSIPCLVSSWKTSYSWGLTTSVVQKFHTLRYSWWEVVNSESFTLVLQVTMATWQNKSLLETWELL